MANPQPENGFVKLANEIWNEIIRRDFSKRQKDIILFIWRLSYGCQKKTALIPLLKDFELCGIGYQNIRKELDHLFNCRVVRWDKNSNIFSVNKDYEQWQISPVKGWDEEKFKELISKNLDERKAITSQNKKLGASQNKKPERGSQKGELLFASQNKKWLLLKTRSSGFLKREARLPSNPWGCKAKGVSKDIIKNNIKDSSCCLREDDSKNGHNPSTQNGINPASQDAVLAGDADSFRKADGLEYRRQVADLYLMRRGKGLEISVKDELFLDQLIADEVPIHVALAGITKAFDKFKPQHKRDEIKSLSYCEGIIYALLAEQPKEEESKEDVQSDSSNPSEDDCSEEEYKKMLEKLKAKRGVET